LELNGNNLRFVESCLALRISDFGSSICGVWLDTTIGFLLFVATFSSSVFIWLRNGRVRYPLIAKQWLLVTRVFVAQTKTLPEVNRKTSLDPL